MQTSYNYAQAAGYAGLVADGRPARIVSRVNPVVAIPFGVAVCRGVDGNRDVKLPTTAAEAAACTGIAIAHAAIESSASGDPQYPTQSDVSVLEDGVVWVTVEEDVTAGNPAYARFATGVADNTKVQKGAFRKSPDGVAQVMTLTPTAANTANYSLALYNADGSLAKSVQVTSDADGTATEICDALRTALGVVTGFTFGGTATLTVTAAVAGEGFSVQTSQNIAVAATTPNSQSAARVKGFSYETGASAGGLAKLVANKPMA